jgi:hypothetical protein
MVAVQGAGCGPPLLLTYIHWYIRVRTYVKGPEVEELQSCEQSMNQSIRVYFAVEYARNPISKA